MVCGCRGANQTNYFMYIGVGGCTSPGAPIPEHPAPASRSGQDSYVSKGGPLGGAR